RRWISKRIVLQRRTVTISSEDLQPSPEFEEAVRAALMKHSKAEKFQAVFKVLARWGDVVPLVYEFGTSLTTTDIENNIEEQNWWTSWWKLSKLGKTSTIGGKGQGVPEGGINNWMSQELEGPDWRVVRVVRVISAIDLLDHELQQQLASLYTSVLSFDPPLLDGKTDVYATWDDTPHAMKAMSKVVVRCGIRICGLSAAYRDGSQSNSYGLMDTEHVFELNTGEYITDVVVWVNDDYISAIQFVTTTGRFSPIYGGYLGVPKILSSAGGVLAGFSGRMTKPRDNQDTVGRVQVTGRLHTSEEQVDNHSTIGLSSDPHILHTSAKLTFGAEMGLLVFRRVGARL
ncbi:hypothetical protein FRC12_000570, partial [Ceratobasidium sp. 428]